MQLSNLLTDATKAWAVQCTAVKNCKSGSPIISMKAIPAVSTVFYIIVIEKSDLYSNVTDS